MSFIVLAGFSLSTFNLPLPRAGVGPCGHVLCCCPLAEREAGRCCCAALTSCESQPIAQSHESGGCPRCHHHHVAAEDAPASLTPQSLLVPGRCHGHPDVDVTEGIVIISVNTAPWSPACDGSGTISLSRLTGYQRPEAPPSPPPRAG